VRRLGSAALDLCYVAAGRLDAFWEQRLKPWDITAGALLVQEAGGLVTALDGSPFTVRTSDIIASNRHLHDQMSAAIAGFRAGRSADPGGPRG
jgi:myo-inositol-1(or 4)-monophosphatase